MKVEAELNLGELWEEKLEYREPDGTNETPVELEARGN